MDSNHRPLVCDTSALPLSYGLKRFLFKAIIPYCYYHPLQLKIENVDRILKALLSFLAESVETVIIALVIFLVVYLFIGQPHRVDGDSMLPNFENGELIITDKLTYKFRSPKRGEVIIFKSPLDNKKVFIKRIIGLPGETITISNGSVFINGQKLTENYIHQSTDVIFGPFIKENETKQIPADSFFVMGDNRANSLDSRELGFIKKPNIIGKAWVIYWPLNKFSLVSHQTYP